MKTKYNLDIVKRVADMPHFHLGQLVTTPDGRGIIVELKMDWNGLYISEETSKMVVWYSTSEAANGWVSKQYSLKEIAEFNKTPELTSKY